MIIIISNKYNDQDINNLIFNQIFDSLKAGHMNNLRTYNRCHYNLN